MPPHTRTKGQHRQQQKRNRTNRTTTTNSSSDDGDDDDDYDDDNQHLVRPVSDDDDDDESVSEDLDGIDEEDSSDESMEEEQNRSNPIQNFVRQVGFSCYQFKEHSKIKSLQYQLTKNQKRFGVEYLGLIETGTASQQKCKSCLNQSMKKIIQIQKEINDRYDAIEERKSALMV
mmetsp:Transcript_29807/g.72233  ORF Transcript_29807/g.72233 Transcript_29807/m.72233 type:complete len:174 (-) Transcript_29807:1038-1559(-)